jgi:hypothetical protein
VQGYNTLADIEALLASYGKSRAQKYYGKLDM